MQTIITTLAAFFLIISGIYHQQPALVNDSVTFIVVRHAEKVDSSTDPDLSEAGMDRARKFAETLQYTKVDGLFSTPYKRTRQTLGILAEKQGLPISDYDPRRPNVLLDSLKSQSGKVFAIAGHSNTAPHIVNYLIGENRYKDLEDQVYDHLWIVHLFADGSTKTILLHY